MKQTRLTIIGGVVHQQYGSETDEIISQIGIQRNQTIFSSTNRHRVGTSQKYVEVDSNLIKMNFYSKIYS